MMKRRSFLARLLAIGPAMSHPDIDRLRCNVNHFETARDVIPITNIPTLKMDTTDWDRCFSKLEKVFDKGYGVMPINLVHSFYNEPIFRPRVIEPCMTDSNEYRETQSP